MRPWLHIPVLIFLSTLVLAGWVALRDVPVERGSDRPVMAAPLEALPPPLPDNVLAGTLLDEAGYAVADADLATQQAGRILWTKTDDQGRFRFDRLFPGPLQLAVNVPGRLPESFPLDGPGTGISLALTQPAEPAPSLPILATSDWSGRVRNPMDVNRLGNFEVWLVPTGRPDQLESGVPRRVTTAKDGSFSVPELIHAPYEVHVLPPDREGALEPNLLVPWGQAAPVLDHGSGIPTDAWDLVAGELRGEVRAQGSPVRSAMVMLEAWIDPDTERAQTRVLAPTQTDENGRWSVKDLPPGAYRVEVRGGGLRWEQEVVLEPRASFEVRF